MRKILWTFMLAVLLLSVVFVEIASFDQVISDRMNKIYRIE